MQRRTHHNTCQALHPALETVRLWRPSIVLAPRALSPKPTRYSREPLERRRASRPACSRTYGRALARVMRTTTVFTKRWRWAERPQTTAWRPRRGRKCGTGVVTQLRHVPRLPSLHWKLRQRAACRTTKLAKNPLKHESSHPCWAVAAMSPQPAARQKKPQHRARLGLRPKRATAQAQSWQHGRPHSLPTRVLR